MRIEPVQSPLASNLAPDRTCSPALNHLRVPHASPLLILPDEPVKMLAPPVSMCRMRGIPCTVVCKASIAFLSAARAA